MARAGQSSGKLPESKSEFNGNAYAVKRIKDHGVVLVSLRIEDGIVVETAESEPDIISIQSGKVGQYLRRDIGL